MASVSSFHGGHPLNLWERSCLQSFVDHGHIVELFSYDKIDVPGGVQLADAGEIVSRADYEAFLRMVPGAFAQFSDMFRYELLYRRGGWWVDTDVLCLSQTLPDPVFFLARKKGERINNAIMAFAPRHEFVAAARNFARGNLRKLRSRKRVFIGPDLMSRLVKERNLLHATAAQSVCYPFHQQHVFEMVDPARVDFVKATVANSPMLHLFQENFRAVGFPRNILPPKGSFLADKFVLHGAENAGHMDVETSRRYAEREIQRRAEMKNRPRGWRRKWRNVVAFFTVADRQSPPGKLGKP